MYSTQSARKVKNRLYDCRCDKKESIYLCGRCCLRILEKDVLSHLAHFGQKKMQRVGVCVNENWYNNISKQSCQSAILTLETLSHHQSNRMRNPSSTVSPTQSKHVTFAMNNRQVVNTENDAEDYGPGDNMSVMSETPPTETQVGKPNTSCKNFFTHPILKKPAVTSVAFGHAPSLALSVAKSAPVSRLLQKSVAASGEHASRAAGSTVMCEVSCRKAPCSKKMKHSKYAKTAPKASVPPQTEAVTLVTPQTTKPSVEKIKAEVNLHPTRYLNTTIPASSGHKKPRTMPSHSSSSGNSPKVGLNQLVIVSCGAKKQVYCQLCSVRLRHSTHPSSFNHCLNYVKMKYPGWTASPSELESKLNSIVGPLAEVERGVGFQCPRKVAVEEDVYQNLAALPEDKAVEKVKALLGQKHAHVSSTVETVGTLRPEVASPCEVSSSNYGVDVIDDGSGFSQQPQQYHKILHQTRPIQMTDAVQQDAFEADSETLSEGQVLSLYKSPEVGFAQTHIDGTAQPLATERRGRSDLTSHDPQQPLIRPQKLSSVQTGSLQLQTTLKGQQHPAGPSYSAEQAPTQETQLEKHNASRAQPTTSIGAKAKGCSHLSFYLKACLQDSKSVIGMASVWECRGFSQETFFLCESCEGIISRRDICRHLVSRDHQLKFMWRNYPDFLQMFWVKEDLPQDFKDELLEDVVQELSKRERLYKMDAQCMLLGQELHHFVRMAHFSDALQILQKVKSEEKPTEFHLPISSTTEYDAMATPRNATCSDDAEVSGPSQAHRTT